MKKTLLSLGILGILFLGTGNVFAAPMPRPNQAPPRVEKHQPQPSRMAQPQMRQVAHKPPRHVAPQPQRHVAPPPPKHHIAHQPQPYYATPVYDPGFALKIGNFFLSI